MNTKEMKEMINLMNENALSELELERNGLKIRLKKQPSGRIVEHVAAETTPAAAVKREVPANAEEKFSKTVEITSPMVGTFYSSPSPDSPTFIEIGKRVNTGDIICIIEAMKLMNEIKSEVKGQVVEILVENGSPVEFGQKLFLVEPA